MPREREHTSKKIKIVDYDIADNSIRAWYNGAGELIFVLDETINVDKPNALLVIDSFDERKWDDVLSNDYGIDLETVRPKKDNKYQKLDIEYGGLDVYSELIEAYESDDDLDDALENLNRFRAMAVRRSAKERLSAAEETISKSHDTIERTNDVLSELRARIRELRAKLAEQKRNVGREPTKVSAAKILKTESQIDAINEKLTRAKKRLENAKRRLAAAEDDAEIARAILARRVDTKPARRRVAKPARVSKPAPVVVEDVDEYDNDDESDSSEEEIEEEYETVEPYDAHIEDDADTTEEVEPLFDKDPNVLNDDIAFKPIDFNTNNNAEPVVAPTPLSFTPPASEYDTDKADENIVHHEEPVLENLTSVDVPVDEQEHIEIETNIEPTPIEPEPETVVGVVEPEPVAEITPAEPVATIEPIAPVRPVSPITGYNAAADENRNTKKPTFLYYLMLILLIALSIFTLWLYQQKNGAVVPDLAATTTVSDKTSTDVVETNIPSPFVNTEKVESASESAVVAEPEPVVETAPVESRTIVEPEPETVVAVVEPEPVAVEPEPVVSDVAEPEPVNVTVESPFVQLRTVANYEPEKKPVPTEEEVLARKPGYNVSQNEKMFVAAPEYDTETVSESFVDVESTYSMDTDVQPVPEVVASEITTISSDETSVDDNITCTDGGPTDEYGCCAGEEYSYTDDGFMCCADDGCFPPLR